MECTTRGRLTAALVMLVAFVAGCTAQQVNPPAAEPTRSDVRVAPTTVIHFVPEWMGLVPDQPKGWEELNRRMTSEFQQFNLRPVDDTEYRYGCNGCAPSTADLTAYAPGAFDPTEARKGLPVRVNSDGDGFLTETPERHASTLTWQYAQNAWASVRAMTSATVALDRMVELARALRQTERTPLRLPLAMANLPVDMPLTDIDVDTHRDEPSRVDYGTTIDFASCSSTATGGRRDCPTVTESLSVRILPGEYRAPSGGVPHDVVPVKIGGRDGYYDDTIHRVSVPLATGMLVLFDVGDRDQQAVQDLLAGVTWAPDPGDDATWSAVSDWTT